MATLLIDSELLVLLIVGSASRAYISKHRRLRAYTEADFDLLQELISRYSDLVVTPNTLTEASNLLAYVGEPIKSRIFNVFGKFIGVVGERYLQSKELVEQEAFIRLGLTDAAFLAVGESGCVLVTSDLRLYLAASAKGQEAHNFNHLREARGTV